MGVAILAVPLETLVYRHSSSPFCSRIPMADWPLKARIWRTPSTSATIADEYPALSLPVFHCSSPLSLLSDTTEAPEPPGMTISRLPSTRGDSLMPHWITEAPYFWTTFCDQNTSPVATSRHTS